MKTGFLSFLLLLVLLGLFSCDTASKASRNEQLIRNDAIKAEVTRYCGSCHLFPDAELLDRETWTKKVLPNMGHRFGIYKGLNRDSLFEKGVAKKLVEAAGVFPTEQVISDETWASIVEYYKDQAPEKLQDNSKPLARESSTFKLVTPDFKITRPAVSALFFHEDSKSLFVADCSREKNSTIHVFNSDFKLQTTLGLTHPVSHVTVHDDTLYVLMMGHFIPSDEPTGSLVKAIKDQKGNYLGYSLVLKQLKRPVDIAFADLNNDGKDDIVVCEYGNHTGSLSLFIKERRNRYKKKALQKGPGAIRVVIRDMNQDTHNDIVVLTAHGDERVDIFYNDGHGEFIKESVLRFPPVYGSVFFSLEDINRDGFADIVYINGDNADLSPVLKPYHGVRIFLNDQHNQFSESFFFPMHGAYKAIVGDFDLDGDLDVAAIAFFPDFENHPEQGFVFLENKSVLDSIDFEPFTFPGLENGRWITMVGGDFDSDGDEDLVLGSFTSMEIQRDSSGQRLQRLRETSPPFIFLKNTTR